jgi:dTDP-4-dehydrorhamnose reductase
MPVSVLVLVLSGQNARARVSDYPCRAMRILITGGGGMLGHDVAAAAQAAGHDPVSLARAELDITDFPAVYDAVADSRPEAIVNCAAWTDVDGAEADYEAALAVNGDGAGSVAAAAQAAGAWLIHVSTDYVFDGDKREPYLESDPVAPRSGYGRSKLAGEQAVADAAPDRHTIVRSSWLFGAGGRCFPQTILRLASERDRLTVVEDQVGCPTFTGHLGAALVGIAGRGREAPRGILHLAGGGECSWFEFAREIVAAGGVESCEVVPVSTQQFPRPAPRPAYSVLRSERGAAALPHWRRGLSDYMAVTAEVGAA